MLSVSLHGIQITAPIGLYPQEHILGNVFEVDADVYLPDAEPWPYADYVVIREVVTAIFNEPGQYLETFTARIHAALKKEFEMAVKIRVAVRKLNPPMPGQAAFAQVCYEA